MATNDIDHYENVIKVPSGHITKDGIEVKAIYDGAMVGLDIVTSYSRFSIATTTNKYLLYYYTAHSVYDFVYTVSNANVLANYTDIAVLSPLHSGGDNIYGLNRYGNFTITIKGDRIIINRGIWDR